MRLTFCRVLVILWALIFSSLAQAQPTALVKVHSAWSVYAHSADGAKLCFTASQPRSSEPTLPNRSAAYVYISTWPKEGVKAEVSILMGYEIKKGSSVTAKVGNRAFTLFTEKDKAWVADPTEELKMIDAMKAGASMSVEGTTANGQQVTDTYSLSGITASVRTMSDSCS